jgi:hypothetical protein
LDLIDKLVVYLIYAAISHENLDDLFFF